MSNRERLEREVMIQVAGDLAVEFAFEDDAFLHRATLRELQSFHEVGHGIIAYLLGERVWWIGVSKTCAGLCCWGGQIPQAPPPDFEERCSAEHPDDEKMEKNHRQGLSEGYDIDVPELQRKAETLLREHWRVTLRTVAELMKKGILLEREIIAILEAGE